MEEKFKGFKLHHSYRRFNTRANEHSTIASGQKPILDGVFTSNLYEPSYRSTNWRKFRASGLTTKSLPRPRVMGCSW